MELQLLPWLIFSGSSQHPPPLASLAALALCFLESTRLGSVPLELTGSRPPFRGILLRNE